MASSELSARLRFLNETAHLLATTAPSTSRHLRSRCTALMSENGLVLSDTQKGSVCGACGTISVLGWNSTMHTESQPSRRRMAQLDGKAAKQTKILNYQCKICGSKTRSPLGAPPSTIRRKPMSSDTRLLATSHSLNKAIPSPSVPLVKSNSKKRAKARRGGLEALLAAKKADPEAPGFGLDLMDFMTKS